MKNIFLILVMSMLVSCKVTPKDGSYEKIIANDPIVGRASITCLQKPAHHQPVPVRIDKRDRRTQEVTDQYDCMESELMYWLEFKTRSIWPNSSLNSQKGMSPVKQ